MGWTISNKWGQNLEEKNNELQYTSSHSNNSFTPIIWVCLKMNSVPLNPVWFCWSFSLWKMAISLGILTQHFQTNPSVDICDIGILPSNQALALFFLSPIASWMWRRSCGTAQDPSPGCLCRPFLWRNTFPYNVQMSRCIFTSVHDRRFFFFEASLSCNHI